MEKISRDSVLIKLNSDLPEVKKLRETYAVKGLPTVILLDPKGQEVDRILGYSGREEFAREYLGYLYGVGTLADLLARAGEKPGAETAQAIAEKYLGRGAAAEALAWVDKARAGKGYEAAMKPHLDLLEAEALLATDPEKGRSALAALAADPKAGEAGEEAFSTLGRYLKKKQMDGELEALYDKVKAFRGDQPDFLNDYAWTFAERGIALEKAAAAAQKAVELSESDPGILDTLAEVYFKMGKKELAVATIEKAIAAKPDDTYFQDQKKKFLGEASEKK